MKKLVVFLLLSVSSFAQRPQPYVAPSVILNSGGYTPVSPAGVVGVMEESKRFSFDTSAFYAIGGKSNDGTVNNSRGNSRGFIGNAFYHVGNTFFGGGASWSQLRTTNYMKESWHLNVGGGHDWIRDNFSMRGQVLYGLPARNEFTKYPDGSSCKCTNGSQGPVFSVWFPSPRSKSHILIKEQVGIFRFHTTVTAPNDPVLTHRQESQHGFTGSFTTSLIFRF